jgi:hypothetical protein
MSNLSDVIVSLWMLPVVVFIALPLAILIIYSGNRILRKISSKKRTSSEPMPSISRRRTKEAI